MLLPNAITYPGFLFALLTRVLLPYLVGPAHFDDLPQLLNFFPTLPLWLVSLIGAVIGAIAGGGSLWLMGFLWEKLRGVEAMGFGDVKMMFVRTAHATKADYPSSDTHGLLYRGTMPLSR
jgi:leader peptidase (prepilin peptidase)/N-methyltransferase